LVVHEFAAHLIISEADRKEGIGELELANVKDFPYRPTVLISCDSCTRMILQI